MKKINQKNGSAYLNVGETKSIHTPGPWKYINNHKEWGDVILGPANEPVVSGSCYYDLNVNDANASLIAAAPELLKALKTCVQQMIEDVSYVPGTIFADTVVEADKAIAKAEGR